MAATDHTPPDPPYPIAPIRFPCLRNVPASRNFQTLLVCTPARISPIDRKIKPNKCTSGNRFSAYTIRRHVLPHPPLMASELVDDPEAMLARTVAHNYKLSLEIRPSGRERGR